ncbi:MAG: hypothetical protein FRX49_12233 [Trebouxia sp. A1-2]|nr:MAG: hypothetical protein FRX49_12233 [Trebouxia sp. A1-2]
METWGTRGLRHARGAALGGRHERLKGHEQMGSSSPDGISACQIYQQLTVVDQRFQWPARGWVVRNVEVTMLSTYWLNRRGSFVLGARRLSRGRKDLAPPCGGPVTVLKLPVIPSEAMSQDQEASRRTCSHELQPSTQADN